MLKRVGRLDKIEELGIVHLQKHAGDFSCKARLVLVDERVESLTDHVLLLLRVGLGKSLVVEWLAHTHAHAPHGSGLHLSAHHLRGHLSLVAHLAVELDGSGSTTARTSLSHRTGPPRHHLSLHPAATLHDHAGVLGRHGTTSRRSLAGEAAGLHGSTTAHGATSKGLAHGLLLHAVRLRHGRVTVAAGSTTASSHGTTGRKGRPGKGEGTSALPTRAELGLALLSIHVVHVGHRHALNAGREAHTARGIRLSEVSTAQVLALVKRHDDGLGTKNFAVELGDGASRLLGRAKAHKAKSLGWSPWNGIIAHDLGAGDRAKWSKRLLEEVVGDGVIEVFDKEVHAAVLGHVGRLQGVDAALNLTHALRFLLATANVELKRGARGGGILKGLVVQIIEGLFGRLVILVVDETKAPRLAFLVLLDEDAAEGTERLEESLELSLVPGSGELLGVEVGPLGLARAILVTKERRHAHLEVLNDTAVDVFDGVVSRLGRLVVHIAVSLGHSVGTSGNLAGKNVAKHGKGVKELLVVNGGVEVLDENVAHAGLAKTGITLRPHDTAGLATNVREVHSVESALGVLHVVKVDVSITKAAAGDGIAANTDRGHGANAVEHLEEDTFGDLILQVAHVKRCRLKCRGRSGRATRRCCGSGGCGSSSGRRRRGRGSGGGGGCRCSGGGSGLRRRGIRWGCGAHTW